MIDLMPGLRRALLDLLADVGASPRQISQRAEDLGYTVGHTWISDLNRGRRLQQAKVEAFLIGLKAVYDESASTRGNPIDEDRFNFDRLVGRFPDEAAQLGGAAREVIGRRAVPKRFAALLQDIAPPRLKDRGQEIGSLTRFSTGAQGYLWWKAPPWAGKTALSSWFVLHPPAGTRIVFFISSTYPARRVDSGDFILAMAEQLAVLTGARLPTGLSFDALDQEFRRLLQEAAAQLGNGNEHLVIVVDGLDEDSAAQPGSGRPSIASLLPARPPANVHVVVTSRDLPALPTDVAPDHPLRTAPSRHLSPWPHAAAIRARAEHEVLDHLSTADTDVAGVVGFMVAAGGGLSASDLAVLLDRTEADLKILLRRRFARVLAELPMNLASGTVQTYAFAHPELHVVARETLGSDVTRFAEQIEAWAERTQDQGWPETTSPYLLRPYSRMLAASHRAERMTALATDIRRHDRMLLVTGADRDGIAEIEEARNVYRADPEVGLATLAALALCRTRLRNRNNNLPVALPSVLAHLGRITQAEAAALTMQKPGARAAALADLADVLTASSVEDAGRVARVAERELAAETWPRRDRTTTGRLITVFVRLGMFGDARRVIDAPGFGFDFERVEQLCRLAVCARNHDPELSRQLMNEVSETLRDRLPDGVWAVRMLTAAASAALPGDGPQVSRLLRKATAIANELPDSKYHHGGFHGTPSYSYPRRNAREYIARAWLSIGNYGEAERVIDELDAAESWQSHFSELINTVARNDSALAREILERTWRTAQEKRPDSCLPTFVRLMIHLGDAVQAARTAKAIDAMYLAKSARHTWLLLDLAEAVVMFDHDHARRLIQEVEESISAPTRSELGLLPYDFGSTPRPSAYDASLQRLSVLWWQVGDTDRALDTALGVSKPAWAIVPLSRIGEAGCDAGDRSTAERVAAALIDILGHQGDHDVGSWMLDSWMSDSDWAHLTRETFGFLGKLVDTELVDTGRRLANAVTHIETRAEALLTMARSLASSDTSLGLELAAQAATLSRSLTDPEWTMWIPARIAAEFAHLGRFETAGMLASTVADESQRAAALLDVANALHAAGRASDASAILDEVVHGPEPTRSLREVYVVRRLGVALARAGRFDEAIKTTTLLHHGSGIAQIRSEIFAEVARAAAEFGNLDRAWLTAHDLVGTVEAPVLAILDVCLRRGTTPPQGWLGALGPHAHRRSVIQRLISGLVERRDVRDAEEVTLALTGLAQAFAMGALAHSLAHIDPAQARAWLERAIAAAAAVRSNWHRIDLLRALLTASTALPGSPVESLKLEMAEAISALPTPWQRWRQTSASVTALAGCREFGEAERAVQLLPDRLHRFDALSRLATHSAVPAAVRSKLFDATDTPGAPPDDSQGLLRLGRVSMEDASFARFALALAADGDFHRARTAVRRIGDPGDRATGLIRVAKVFAGSRPDRALNLAREAAALALDKDWATHSVITELLSDGGPVSALEKFTRSLFADLLAGDKWSDYLTALRMVDAAALDRFQATACTVYLASAAPSEGTNRGSTGPPLRPAGRITL
ncbi:hypothetical protein [Nonomuraea sp. NPDC050310]|uniref:hypothetical protein n=1 Tax=Nonomuraea sp. NPDC050310 TaxID=3154935 RepID=UPI00340349D3